MSDYEDASTEQILAHAQEIYDEGVQDKFETLCQLPVVEGGIAWLNAGLCSHYSSADEERVVFSILARGLAAMMADGWELVKREEENDENTGGGAREEAADSSREG